MARQDLDHFSPANGPMMQDKSVAKCSPPRKAFRHRFKRPKPLKIEPGSSKIESRGLQNRGQSPPRRIFQNTFNLRSFLGAKSLRSGGQNGQLGSILEAQEAPKSSPKPGKNDVEKQPVFGIDFGRVRTSFWKGFW